MAERQVSTRPVIEWASASSPLPGQPRSGDEYAVITTPDGALVAAVDGLGHGDEAAAAAQRAVALLLSAPAESLIFLIRRCHVALVGTRGVVATLAQFSIRDDTVTWLAVGNVHGVLLRADPAARLGRETIVPRAGVVGYNLPPLAAAVHTIARGDTVVLATDGVRPDFIDDQRGLSGEPQAIADGILAKYGQPTDDALVVVARYLGHG